MRIHPVILRALAGGVLLLSFSVHADWRTALPDAQLVGAGEFRVLGFAIYQAQFWSADTALERPLDMNSPFALELTYRRAISRNDLVDTSIKEIRRLARRSLDSELLARWEQEMMAAFVNVQAGDRITGVFLPGKGAQFYVADVLHHSVADEAFARAFFAIWLDERTRNPKLRAQLLGAKRL